MSVTTSPTDASINRKQVNYLLAFLIPTLAVFSLPKLVGVMSTGWDTHDLCLVNFIYLRDCLASGHVPLWNPLIQSGTFFPSLNNIGLFTPFEFPFVILALLVPPILAFEWMIQFIVLLGGIGIYAFFRSCDVEHDLASLGAALYAVTTLVINVGQLQFVFSLGTLPWLFVAARSIVRARTNASALPLFGIVLGFAFASGYPWMTVVNTSLFCAYVVHTYCWDPERTDSGIALKRFLLFLIPLLAVYALLISPGYTNLKLNYSHLLGDYVNPEPRLRGFGAPQLLEYKTLGIALASFVSAALLSAKTMNPICVFGIGWTILSLGILAVIRKPKLKPEYYFWIALMLAGISYSCAAGPVRSAISRLPLFNSNRFWTLGVDYAVAGWVILTFLWLNESFGNSPLKATGRNKVFLLLALAAAAFWLFSQSRSYQILVLIGLSLVLTTDNFLRTRWRQFAFLLTLAIVECVLILGVYFRFTLPGESVYPRYSNLAERRALQQRTVSPVIIDRNNRRLGSQKEYDFQDSKWYVDKSPYSHGYDNLGNPLYWYVKDMPIVAHLFTIETTARPEAAILRRDYKTDNSYMDAVAADIMNKPDTPTVDVPLDLTGAKGREIILHTELQPNSGIAQVRTGGPALVVFSDNSAPGWEASIDGKRTKLIAVDRLFMGALIPEEGTHTVEFRYRPTRTMAALISPYLALLISAFLA